MAEHKIKEPMVHIVKRSQIPFLKAWGIRILAVLLALIVSGVVSFLVTKENPIKIYAVMIDGTFGTQRRLWATLQGLAMLLCVSIGVTPAFRMRFWNVGGEGQVLMGGLASAACMILF